MLCGDLNEKEIKKTWDTCICMADYDTAETNITVKQPYSNKN